MDTHGETKAAAARAPSHNYGDFTADWISSKLSEIDLGMIEMMEKSYSSAALREAAIAANELGYAMYMLGFRRAWKLAVCLEQAFQNPTEKKDLTEQLIIDAIALRFELPCSTFM